jgi:hypothetical protein
MNPAGLRARSLGLGESTKPIRYQLHLGGRLKFSLNGSNSAVFFCGVSGSRFNIGTSALLFFVPNKSVNHACIDGGSLLYQVGRARILKRSILRDAVQLNLFQRLNFVVAQAAGVASFIAAHNKSLNTGLAIRSRSLFNTGCSQPVKQTLCGFPSN